MLSLSYNRDTVNQHMRDSRFELMGILEGRLIRDGIQIAHGNTRVLAESVRDQFKNISPSQYTSHRSPANFPVNLLSRLIAYRYQPKKPPLQTGSGCSLPRDRILSINSRLVQENGAVVAYMSCRPVATRTPEAPYDTPPLHHPSDVRRTPGPREALTRQGMGAAPRLRHARALRDLGPGPGPAGRRADRGVLQREGPHGRRVAIETGCGGWTLHHRGCPQQAEVALPINPKMLNHQVTRWN